MIEIRPQPGPQEAFLACDADIAIYAGAAGAGKTFAALISLAMGSHIPGYAAVAFRRTSPELTGGGSIWSESRKLYPSLGAAARESPTLDWTFPSGATIEFRHLQHEWSVDSHQSKQYAQVLFEELTHFEESQFWYLFSRCRSTCGVKPYMRATCNPDPDSFVRRLIDWWIAEDGTIDARRSGVKRWFVRNDTDGKLEWGGSAREMRERFPHSKPKSMAVIRATLDDNQALLKVDPEYRDRLMSMPIVQRKRLLDGDWNARVEEGSLFRRPWFRVVDTFATRIVRRVRAWDRAATEPTASNPDPDWTAGVRWGLSERNELVLEHIEYMRGTPAAVWDTMRAIAESDPPGTTVALFQDPGAAGKSDDFTARRELIGHHVKTHPARASKVAMAELWSPLVERGNVYVTRAPWNERFFRAAEAFPKGSHDDEIDAASLGIIELGVRPTIASKLVQPGYLPKPHEAKPEPAKQSQRLQIRRRYQ